MNTGKVEKVYQSSNLKNYYHRSRISQSSSKDDLSKKMKEMNDFKKMNNTTSSYLSQKIIKSVDENKTPKQKLTTRKRGISFNIPNKFESEVTSEKHLRLIDTSKYTGDKI